MSDAYHLLMSTVQLERIHKALVELDKVDPINPKEPDLPPDLEFLTDTIGGTLMLPPGEDTVHGICL